ncbi:MAG: hypothetical protein RLZZ595_167 [Bacteroidota bacterium]|jgi:hypothetical protein
MKYISILLVLLLFGRFTTAQDSPSALRISLVTCTPGSELYSVFGHNALRIVDSAAGTDIAYNFGTFNFDDPDFYTKFVRGKLLYYLSQENFSDFLYAYNYFKRGVSEQVLNLSDQEKKTIQKALFENLREENKNYKYDFFYDNCSTRLRDIIFKTKSANAFDPPSFVEQGLTFRDHLHTYLDKAKMEWTKLGIDVLLGLDADKEMSTSNAMFLPEFLKQGASVALLGPNKLVSEEIVLLPDQQPAPDELPFWKMPLFVFVVVALILFPSVGSISGVLLSVQSVLEKSIFMASGLLGFLLVFIWVGTDHQSMANNLNLVWAFPLNLILGFKTKHTPKWLKYYAKIYTAAVLVLLVAAMVKPGIISFAFFPLMLALSYRSWICAKSIN